jgi:hypothetical protein
MKIDRDQLIRRVAEKHRLILTEDDPLIASVTLNEVIFESHSHELLQKMDEQNARVLASLQMIVATAKSEQSKTSEALNQTLMLLHKKNLEDYKSLTNGLLIEAKKVVQEAVSEKNNARIASLAAAGFGVLFFLANLWLIYSNK